KRNSSGAEYLVGDMIHARVGLALSVTRELDFQVIGDGKRAYGLKQDNEKIIPGATLNTISPQMIVHMNSSVDFLIGGTFVSNRSLLAGKEHAFGDISYEGLLGDQVTIGLALEI